MKSIILAGGYGTRLGEMGEQLPKGLIEFNGTNLISRVVDELTKIGVSDIAVVTNSKYFALFENWVAGQKAKITLLSDNTTSPENRLGALGDLNFAIHKLGWEKENILVTPSDTYFTFSLSTFMDSIQKNPQQFSTIVRKMDTENIKERLGCAVLSETGMITTFVEKPVAPPSPYAAIPFYYYPSEIHTLLHQYAAEGNSMDAPGNIIPWLLKNNYPVHAHIVTDNTIDVGTLKEVELLKSMNL